MEKEDIDGIAGAVAKELANLNKENENEEGTEKPESFKCPECGATINAMSQFCGNCGAELVWRK